MFDSSQNSVPANQKCCLNCIWFEQRTGFCRKNPPTPIPTFVKGIGYITNSAFPKITIPELDWCSFFRALTSSCTGYELLND